jgi:hypothetical protein
MYHQELLKREGLLKFTVFAPREMFPGTTNPNGIPHYDKIYQMGIKYPKWP